MAGSQQSSASRVLSTLLTIGVSVFLVSGIVVAATTIGSSLSTDGNLTVLGNVGIGTSTPSARFSVAGSSYLGSASGDALTIHTGTINYPVSSLSLIPQLANSWSAATSSAATPILSLDGANGRVGIGIASPGANLSELLEVRKNYNGGTWLGVWNSASNTAAAAGIVLGTQLGARYGTLVYYSAGYTTTFGSDVPGSFLLQGGNQGPLILASEQSQHIEFFTRVSGAPTEKMRLTNAGNLGIGTTTPAGKLHITGSAYPQLVIDKTTANFNSNISFRSNSVDLVSIGPNQLVGDDNNFEIYSRKSGATGSRLFINLTSGNVGIGTTGPTTKLEIKGPSGSGTPVNVLTLRSTDSGIGDGPALQFLDGASDLLGRITSAIDSSGVTSIKFTTFEGLSATVNRGKFRITSNNAGFNVPNAQLELFEPELAVPVSIQAILQSGFNQDIAFVTVASNAQTERMRILAGGNVGIGTTSPAWLLNVAGTRPSLALTDNGAGVGFKHWLLSSMGGEFYISTSTDLLATSSVPALTILSNGNVGIGTSTPGSRLAIEGRCVDTSTGCADIAERYPSSEYVEPGDIVGVDTTRSGYVRKATRQSIPLGIVSTNPAIAIEGSALQLMTGTAYINSPTKPAIALAGRVPVKVTAESGSISIGDRITIGSTPGIGKRATTNTEPTVGIALEPYSATGHGSILAFVSLGQSQLTAANGALSSAPFTSDLDLNGHSLFNVKALTSRAGSWSLDENGTLVVKKLKADSIEVSAGVTVKDQITGDPFCIVVENGAVVSKPGACPLPSA